MKTVTRRNAFRGMQVTVTERDGTTHTGTMMGFGPTHVQVQTATGWRDFARCTVTVTAQS